MKYGMMLLATMLLGGCLFSGAAGAADGERSLKIVVDKAEGQAYVTIKICVPVDVRDLIKELGASFDATNTNAVRAIVAKARDGIENSLHQLAQKAAPVIEFENEPSAAVAWKEQPRDPKTGRWIKLEDIKPTAYVCGSGGCTVSYSSCSSGSCGSGGWSHSNSTGKPASDALNRR